MKYILPIFVLCTFLNGCTEEKVASVSDTKHNTTSTDPKNKSTPNNEDTPHKPESTQKKIATIKNSLQKEGKNLINRIEICDHLAGELNGIPAEDTATIRDMKKFNCESLDSDISKVTDPAIIEAVNLSKEILEEQFQ